MATDVAAAAAAPAPAPAPSGPVLVGRKDTTHPYEDVELRPDTQNTPQDPALAHLRPPPPRIDTEGGPQASPIFVGMASFRDAVRCGYTLWTAFGRAKNPDRVRIGVYDQTIQGDGSCLEEYCKLAGKGAGKGAGGGDGDTNAGADCPRRDQVRIMESHAGESRGPLVSRHHLQKLIRHPSDVSGGDGDGGDGDESEGDGEGDVADEFCLHIDAHSEFTYHWDYYIIQDWLMTENEMGVVTTYIHDIGENIDADGNKKMLSHTPHICDVVEGVYGVPRNEAPTTIYNAYRPILQSKWGAGFSFSKCHSEAAVPFDVNANWVFDGEEFSRAALLWMDGYDMYSPSHHGHIVYHNYTKVEHHYKDARKNKRNEELERIKGEEELMGHNRIKLHIGQGFSGPVNTTELFRYNPSHRRARSPEAFQDFTGVYFDGRKWEHRCYQLHWVPYEHPESVEARLPGWRMQPPLPSPLSAEEVEEQEGMLQAQQLRHWQRWREQNQLQQQMQQGSEQWQDWQREKQEKMHAHARNETSSSTRTATRNETSPCLLVPDSFDCCSGSAGPSLETLQYMSFLTLIVLLVFMRRRRNNRRM